CIGQRRPFVGTEHNAHERQRHVRSFRPMQRLHPFVRIVAAVALVAAVAGLARLFDVDLTAAALLLLVSVLVAGGLGLAPGIAGALTAWLALNLLFTAPTGSLKIEHSDDVVS